jgi:CubicO group peptidase (beta-lactamase class C family)
MLLIIGASTAVAADQPKDLDELRQRIEDVIKSSGTPAIGIALVNRDGPYWVAGWGKANLATGKAADENTLFRIGSISKMFAALAVLKLVEEGKLSLDDKLRDRAPEVKFANEWEDTHPVRVVHLLEHTTGWDDAHLPEYAYAAPDTMTTLQALEFHPHSRISRWMPGTRHSYCNTGTLAAAYVVEKVTGQRYEDYIDQTFFKPLGMSSTSYFRTSTYDERGATLYQGLKPQEYWRLLQRPAGSINASASDMAKFLHFLLLRGATPSTRIVSEQSLDRMEVPASTLGNAAGIVSGYGLANYVSGHKASNAAFRGHNGGVHGGLSELMYLKETGQGYVFMINSGNGAAMGQVAELLKDYLLRDVKPPAENMVALPAAFREIDGYYLYISPRQEMMRYQNNLTAIFKVTHDDRFLHRSPLFGPWTSNDRPANDRVLIDAWHGLPAIAIVEDPLAGQALQMNGELFQRVPAWKVFTPLVVSALLPLMTLVGIVALVVWGFRRTRKRTPDGRLMLRLWPLIASVLLAALFVISGIGSAFLNLLGSVSPLSIGLFLVSLGYAAVVLAGAIYLLSRKGREFLNLPYWFAAAFVLVHLLVAGYLGYYGIIGIRTWA